MDRLFELVMTSLWAPETYAKFAFLGITAPFWLPLARVMYAELRPALHAQEAGEIPRRPPGEDPFLNIPLASRRARRVEPSARVVSAARPDGCAEHGDERACDT
jgi:hypothetical protein